MMTSAQVVKISVTTTDNSPSQDYTHPDNQTTLLQKNTSLKGTCMTALGPVSGIKIVKAQQVTQNHHL